MYEYFDKSRRSSHLSLSRGGGEEGWLEGRFSEISTVLTVSVGLPHPTPPPSLEVGREFPLPFTWTHMDDGTEFEIEDQCDP